MFIPLFLFTVGMMVAVTICSVWAKLGGDEKFGYVHPKLRKILHTLHHWMFGLFLVSICPLFVLTSPIIIPVFFILGLGLGLFIDDVVFHNFECYFERKI
jgi:hypothetical protein